MPRHSALRFAVPLGAALAGFCGTSAWAQTTSEPNGLRPAFDDSGQDSQQRWTRPRRAAPAETLPRSGNGPGSGAGRTGFNSTNVPTQRTRQPPGAGRNAAAKGASAKKPPPLSPPPPTKAARAGKQRATVVTVPLGVPSAAPRADLSAPAAPDVTGVVPPSDAVVLPAPVVVPPRLRPVQPEEDPFAPTGVHAGTFLLRPALEVMSGYDTNPARVAGGKGSPAFTVAPELIGRSDWERHELDIAIRGTYYYYPEVPFADRPNLDARADGRIDVTKDTRIDVQGRYIVSTDYPGSPNIAADFAKLPIYTDVGATLGVGQRFNRFDLSLKGTFDRIDWRESVLTDGTTSGNADRDYNQYGAQLRGSYEVSPGVKPFAEVDADTRIHDLQIDRTGADRDSTGVAVKVGTAFEFTRTLTGEISVGYLARDYQGPNLPDIRAPLLDAALIWAATGLTTIKFSARTTVDESVVPDVSGVLRHDNGIEISHALRRWLIATGTFGYGHDDYVGEGRQDDRYYGIAGLIYKLNPLVQIKGQLRHDWLTSTQSGNAYQSTSVLLTLRLQR